MITASLNMRKSTVELHWNFPHIEVYYSHFEVCYSHFKVYYSHIEAETVWCENQTLVRNCRFIYSPQKPETTYNNYNNREVGTSIEDPMTKSSAFITTNAIQTQGSNDERIKTQLRSKRPRL